MIKYFQKIGGQWKDAFREYENRVNGPTKKRAKKIVVGHRRQIRAFTSKRKRLHEPTQKKVMRYCALHTLRKMKGFKRVKAFDEGQKSQVSRSVRLAFRQIHLADAWMNAADDRISRITFNSLIALVVVLPLFLYTIMTGNYFVEWIETGRAWEINISIKFLFVLVSVSFALYIYLLFAVISLFLNLFLLIGLTNFFTKLFFLHRERQWQFCFFFFQGLLNILAIQSLRTLAVLSGDQFQILFLLDIVMLIGSPVVTLLFVTATISNSLRRAIEFRWRLQNPKAVMLTEFLSIINSLERYPDTWASPYHKRIILNQLETCAVCAERGLPKVLRSGDIATDSWLLRMTQEIAAGIRERKRWILLPQKETQEHFLNFCTDTVLHLCRGDWDSLERATPTPFTRKHFFRSTFLPATRIIVLSCAPLLVLFLVQRSPLALKEPINHYATALAIVWTAASFLASLDPLFSVKIAALKDLSQLLPISGKSGKDN